MRRVPLVPVALVLMACIALGRPLLHRLDRGHWTHRCPEKTFITLCLTETPHPRLKSYRASAQVKAIDNQSRHGDITVYLRKDSIAETLRYGDQLLLHGYPDTLKRSIYITSDHYLILHRDSTSFRARIEKLRMRLLHRMQNGPLEQRYAGVAEAMTLGWRGDLDENLQATYRDSGLIHMLCVSGLHVGLLAMLVGWLTIWAGRERRGRIIRGSLQLISVWSFAVITGLAPSTVRAALMFSLFIVSDILARRTSKMNLLAAAAIIMLVAKPSLLFSVSWQLSFAAVAGILMAKPIILCFRSRLVQCAVVSTAATVATLPIIVSTFHRIPLYFLIANVVIVPFASLLLVLSLGYLAIPCTLFAWPLELLLRFTDTVTEWVSSLPHAAVEGVTLNPWQLVLLIIAVLLLFAGAQRTGQCKNRSTA